MRAVTSDSPRPSKRHSPLGILVSCAVVFLMFVNYVEGQGASGATGSTGSNRPQPNPVAMPRNVAARPVAPPPPPEPSIEETTVGGRVLRTVRNGSIERYEVPDLGLVTANKLEAIAAIRLPAFIEATGLSDPGLLARYLDADLNRSGRLSFDELSAFQRKTYKEFRYESNELALRPDLFLSAGGGDCEDFALYTAGLLRFWGWEPYLGQLSSARGSTGHAVCLSLEGGSFPGGFAYFSLEAWSTEDGASLKDGKYVPIDYDQVGGLSNAVKPSWKLRAVWVPEKAWGLRM